MVFLFWLVADLFNPIFQILALALEHPHDCLNFGKATMNNADRYKLLYFPWKNGWHFADDIFICIFLKTNTGISIKISLNFLPYGEINNIPALIQILALCRRGDKPLSEPMMVSLLVNLCVTRAQWVSLRDFGVTWPNRSITNDILQGVLFRYEYNSPVCL